MKCVKVDSIKGIEALSVTSFVIWNGHEQYNPGVLRSIMNDSTRLPGIYRRLQIQDIRMEKRSIVHIYIPMFIKSTASPGPPFALSC